MVRVQTLTALLLLCAAFPLPARDVSQEQSAVQFARQEYEKVEAEHKADADQAERTKKQLDLLKKQLDAEQKKASMSGKEKQQAKARLEKAEQALDRAWKQ